MNKISVIIPSYNRFTYLVTAIKSVTNQTYPLIEVIVINDGSTDPRYYTQELQGLLPVGSIVVHSAKNSSEVIGSVGKAAYTRNIGLRVATGEYIAFLDDDDEWLPSKLETQMELMKRFNCEMSSSDALSGNGVYISDKVYQRYLADVHKSFYLSLNIDKFPDVWDDAFLQRHNSCITSSVIVSRNVIDKIGFMPYLRVGEDYAYWLRAIKHTKCAFSHIPLVHYDNGHGDGVQY